MRGKNEGTVYKRKDGRWCAQVVLPSGKRKTKYAPTQKAAQDWLIEQRGLVLKGVSSDDNTTVAAFLEGYLETIVFTARRSKTYESYKMFTHLHINPELGRLKMTALQPAHIQAFYARKLQTLANGTVHAIHNYLHSALEKAVKWGVIIRNPSDSTELPRLTNTKPNELLTEEELDSFLEANKETRFYALWLLAITTGMRRSEISGLRWKDVDLDAGRVNIVQSAQRLTGQGVVISELKTKSSRRMVDIPPITIEALRAHHAMCETEMMFVNEDGNIVSGKVIFLEFKKALKRAGCKDVTFHSLRHLHATLLMKANVHPKVVQARLGHSRVNMTLDLYSHIQPGMQKPAVDEMERLLSSAGIEKPDP